MRNRVKLTWRAGVAVIGLAAAALFAGPPTASAQMHTEVVGMPAGPIGAPGSGAVQVGGGYGEQGLYTVHEDHGGPGLSTGGGYAVPMGPICTVENNDRGRGGYNQVSHGSCGMGGGYVESVEGGMIEAHYP